jgi:Raf kinase inhibitor-like YbhB/YbcL family protein
MLSLLLLACIIVSGCTIENPTLPPPTVTVTSNAFQNESGIPVAYTCDGQNMSPALFWSDLPEGAESLAVVMEDRDAPGGPFTHWIIHGIPVDRRELPADIPKDSALPDGIRQGVNDLGEIGYSGPCPPTGETHRYTFTLYALGAEPNLTGAVDRAAFEGAIQDRILITGELTGIYRQWG